MIIVDSSEYEAIEFGEPYQYDEDFHGIETKRKYTDLSTINICIFQPITAGLCVGMIIENSMYQIEQIYQILQTKKYLFWVRPGIPGYSRSFCVERCPTTGLLLKTVINFNNTYRDISYINEGFEKDHICYSYRFKNDTVVNVKATIENYSATYSNRFFCPYSTSKVLERCIPNIESFDTTADDIKEQIHLIGKFAGSFRDISTAIQAVEDIYKSRWTIIICVIIAFVLTILWLTALRCLTGLVVWLTVILAGFSLGLLTYSLFKQMKADFKSGDLFKNYLTRYFFGELNSKFLFITFLGMVTFDVIFIVMVIKMARKINMSCKVIKHSSQLFGKVPTIFIFTAFNYLLLFAWWTFIIFCFVVLFGTGIPSRSFEHEGNSVVDKIERYYESYVPFFILYFVVSLLWVSLFISYLEKTTISAVMSQCYFFRDDEYRELPSFLVLRTYLRMIRYHSGSIALGSILIYLIHPIRALFEAVYVKIHSSHSRFSKCLEKCCCCCMFCYRKGLVYFTKNAFVMLAIHGYNFVGSAKNAFNLTMRNKMNIGVENWVGTFTLYIGRLFVSVIVTAVASWMLNSDEELQFFVAPGIMIFVCSYIATGVFTGVIDISIDSMFICFMEDQERNNDVSHKMYASESLKKFMRRNSRNVSNQSADSALLNNVMIQPKEN